MPRSNPRVNRDSRTGRFVPLNYRHSVTVTHDSGRASTTIQGTDSLNVWTNKRQNGPTVRVDHTTTHRFTNGSVKSRTDLH
jgi:hypothetical protein